MERVEEEDLLYLDYYLTGKDSFCSSNAVCSSPWSPVSCEILGSTEFISHPNLNPENNSERHSTNDIHHSILQSSAAEEESLSDTRPARKNKGISKPKFVSYQSFPPVRGKRFICELCGLKLATKESHKRHVLSQHSKERPYVCEKCGKSFIFNFALKSHKAIHSDIPMFVCVCGVRFKLKTSYMNHVQRIHRAASEVKYSCELCFKSFGDRHTLRLHMISVHKPKTIPCMQKGCKKVFSSISLMHCHYRYHQNQKYTCDKCGQSFSTESYMNKHRLTHSGVRPYTCVDCGKSYLSASHLNEHFRMRHTTVRSFQCCVCGKCFKSKTQLKYHESNHKGEKPYICELCGYATAYKNTYYAHRKKHKSFMSTDSGNVAPKNLPSSIPNFTAGLKKSNSSKNRQRLKKTCPPPIRPKIPSAKENGVSFCVTSGESTASMNSLLISSPPSSTSSSCVAKEGNVDLIIIPPSVITPEQHTNDPLIDTRLQLSLKCSNTVINVVTCNKGDENVDEFCRAEKHDLISKECSCKQVTPQSEKENSVIIISNNGRCAISECESTDDSLLLLKIGENAYAGVCMHHTVSDQVEISELNWNSFENLTLTAIDPKSLNSIETSKRDSVTDINLSLNKVHSVHKPEQELSNQEVLMNIASQTGRSLINDSSPNPSVTLYGDYNQTLIGNCVSLQVPQDGTMKPSCSSMCPDDISSVEEIESGMATLSGHIIDDSFRLAQLEVICPLCDGQYYCMDTYITHLESCHN